MFYYLVSILKSPLAPLTYVFDECVCNGSMVEISLLGRIVDGVVLQEVAKPSFACEKIITLQDTFYLPKTLELAQFVADYYVCSLGEALSLFTPFQKKTVSFIKPTPLSLDITLSFEQQSAYTFALSNDASLLFGDTGSGKTEVYMKLFETVLNEGKQVIFLVPEIGLTPQMKQRLKEHFKERVAMWHSKISSNKKAKILEALAEGKISIVAGTRSALFLPLKHLGLIVVDEEHDESYKSSSRPRYNAKDLALLFGQKQGAKVLLGSATPSLTSFYKLPYFRLRGTFFEASSHVMYDESDENITPLIVDSIQKALNAKKQIIVFLPTRANFKYIACKACGANIECPFCAVGMSLHKHAKLLKCHYCNYTEAIPKVCPKCAHEDIVATRMGTAEVSERLQEYFKNAVVQQFDRDEVRTEKQLETILTAFNEHKIDIMVGTHMLSKGHDYHGVGLAVILGIDALLGMSDFRAREKTLALVKQIAGRSGRKGHGEVIIQTKNKHFFQQYLDHFEVFLNDELAHRKGLYPPFKKMLRLMVSHKNEQKAKEMIEQIYHISMGFKAVEIVGFGKATIGKIAGKYRYELLARSSSSKALLELAHSLKVYRVEVDMDPLSFS